MALYESEYARFMQSWLSKHETIEQKQEEGRSLWWNKPANEVSESRQKKQKELQTKAYKYYE